MKSIKLWEPWYFENSKLPALLSKVYRMEVAAFSAAFWVFARGEMSDRTRRHEAVHYQQQLEMLFIFQWICYGMCWLVGYVKYKDSRKAYWQNPFEQQARALQNYEDALERRKFWGWTKYKI